MLLSGRVCFRGVIGIRFQRSGGSVFSRAGLTVCERIHNIGPGWGLWERTGFLFRRWFERERGIGFGDGCREFWFLYRAVVWVIVWSFSPDYPVVLMRD